MPEAPELQVTVEFLRPRLPGQAIADAQVLKPSVVRSRAASLSDDAVGREFVTIQRRGKFLLLGLSGGYALVINPKLTGGLQYVAGKQRVLKKTCVRFGLSDGNDLRYVDDRQMGQFYYVPAEQVESVPGLAEQGPDVLDNFTFDDFKAGLKGFSGEIKGVLTRGRVISGIGNAYADEILFRAGVYPFKKRRALSDDELRRIHQCSREVILDAIEEVRQRMGDQIDHKARDFLAVHNKGGQPCPQCGNAITELRANQRITSYCRRCQPGMLLKN
ncbi:MAG: Fpg/Nei family DNA glycosylase [Chloroflexi bacterium]|nr:Fpg/Nei family DNA glycosylase [Chloroflexota bacterium]MYD47205.1 Fpg/Nei family DNA glycosylase [Chloroflexota bacterium]